MTVRRSRSWRAALIGRLLYERKHIWLTSTGWYERLSLATGQDGWQVIRVDGARIQLARTRWRRR